MTQEEFKKQRAALVAKLAWLAIEINEQSKYYANFEILGHRSMLWLRIFDLNILNNLPPEYEKIINIAFLYQYEPIIADLQNSYNEMLKYLEV